MKRRRKKHGKKCACWASWLVTLWNIGRNTPVLFYWWDRSHGSSKELFKILRYLVLRYSFSWKQCSNACMSFDQIALSWLHWWSLGWWQRITEHQSLSCLHSTIPPLRFIMVVSLSLLKPSNNLPCHIQKEWFWKEILSCRRPWEYR